MEKRYPERQLKDFRSLYMAPRHPQDAPPDSTLTGDIRVHKVSSRILEDVRTVLVYLPPGFSTHDPWKYPVLYINDGQNVFDRSTSAFGVEWGIDETVEQLIRTGELPGIIMVAIYNSARRVHEYTPSADPVHGGGEAYKYRKFLLEELKPTIDKIYPTSARAEHTGILGSSLGGLCALYLGWTAPKTFGLVGAMSPSLWWAGRDMITYIAGDESTTKPSRLWLDMGTEECLTDRNGNKIPDVIDDIRTLKIVLESKGFQVGYDMIYREVAHATHDEKSWGERVAEVIKFLYPPETVRPVSPLHE